MGRRRSREGERVVGKGGGGDRGRREKEREMERVVKKAGGMVLGRVEGGRR